MEQLSIVEMAKKTAEGMNFLIVKLAERVDELEKDEQSLRGGSKRYKDENNLYVVFDATTNKMLYYVTEKGRKSGSKKLNEALKLKLLTNK